jgi:pyruvate,water dikinase
LLLLAGAVVIDIGGPLSHGVIVARKLGIPCVTNTEDGTRRLKSGDLLRVDGGAGRVERTESGPRTLSLDGAVEHLSGDRT